MSYDEFLDTILSGFTKRLGEDYQFHIHILPRNNGAMTDALFFSRPGQSAMPVVSLRPYYERICGGEITADQALEEILSLICHSSPLQADEITGLEDFDRIRERIMFRLIHTESNPAILADVPHIPFLDLSIVFYLFLKRRGKAQMTTIIRNIHAGKWGVTAADLWTLARKNTPREYPARVMPMQDVLRQLVPSPSDISTAVTALDRPDRSPLYVATNQSGLYGSACILYPDMLREIAGRLDSDLALLPSSVHEILILPADPDTPYQELSQMVTSINREQVDCEDQLSNQVYLYRRDDRLVHVMTNGPKLVGQAKNA
ncbi:MAG: DUF5688 family protein [Clostridiales bacterium]|nr:DUF5688 family protein [Clostridiales bacterium]